MAIFKRIPRCSFVALASLLLSSCSPHREEANELATNYSKWSTAKIQNYKYTIQIGCECGPDTTTPVVVMVRNGLNTTLTRDNNAINNPEKFARYDTMEKVFELAQKVVNSKAAQVSLKYDLTLGYPTSIIVDGHKEVSDDEIGYEITNFEVMQ